MRALRKRPRSDKLVNQARKSSSNLSRRLYLVLLCLLGLSGVNYMWGDLLLLRGDGLVLRDHNVVATGYVAKIANVFVEKGQAVKKGDVLLKIESMELLERLADLSMRQAALSQRAAEFQLRSQVATQLLPIALRRQKETGAVLAQFDDMSARGLLTSARYEEALRANYDANQDQVRLAAEKETLNAQINSLEAARTAASEALKELQSHYGNGIVRAKNDGAIGADVPSVGDVYRSGDPILKIYSGETYVLAYLPTRYLFSIQQGMKVTVSSGRYSDKGVITEILPLSDALPQEFQNSFKPRERNQLAKIKLENPTAFPVFAKVGISYRFF